MWKKNGNRNGSNATQSSSFHNLRMLPAQHKNYLRLCKGQRESFFSTHYTRWNIFAENMFECWKLCSPELWSLSGKLFICAQRRALIPPALYEPRDLTHEWHASPLLSPSPTVNYKHTSATLSIQISPAVHLSSFKSKNPTQKAKNDHPFSVLRPWWLKHVWTCPIKLLDGASMFRVVLRS